MKTAKELREVFRASGRACEGSLLRFEGVGGFDVYNCSVPFIWEGNEYIFGRVERREDYANSFTCLFTSAGRDRYVPVPGAVTYPIEDPHIAVIGGELILGGTHVRKRGGEIDEFYGYYYRGKDPKFLTHFTCGPAHMKDIRLVQLPDGRVGVFTRPRDEQVAARYSSEAIVGYAVLDSVNDLDCTIAGRARAVEGLFSAGEWGGCNQCYLLRDGRIGVIGHRCYREPAGGVVLHVYLNIAFIFDPVSFRVCDMKVIGEKQSYPDTPWMLPYLKDCAFTSGIVMRPDGKADLYSGLGDVAEGRIVIDAPFGDLL